MRVLFIHPNFPAQFRHLAKALGSQPNNQVIFATKNENPAWKIPGVTRAMYAPHRQPNRETHHYLQNFESAVLEGQAVYRTAEQLKNRLCS